MSLHTCNNYSSIVKIINKDMKIKKKTKNNFNINEMLKSADTLYYHIRKAAGISNMTTCGL
jgi:hypothetical protein